MTCHPKSLVVDMWCEVGCAVCLQAKRHFDEALAIFPGKDRVRVNLHVPRLALKAVETEFTRKPGPEDVNPQSLPHADISVPAISDGVPMFVFNQRFYVSGMQSVQRYANALEGMLILSSEVTGVKADFSCVLDCCLV